VDLTKLGRTQRVLAIVGLLAFINSFLTAWYTVSEKGGVVLGVTYGGSQGYSAWQYPSGFLTWFPALLLLAVGVVAALPAFGVLVRLPASLSLIGLGVSAVAVLFYLIQWATYPSAPAGFSEISAGPDWAFFVGLALAIVAGVFSYLGFTAEGGSLAALGQSIKARTQQQPPQEQYQQAPQQYQPPQQPPQQ
jgi:hypothetical protein